MTALPAHLHTYIVNLPRRPDRRRHIANALPPGLPASFTSDWEVLFDGQALTRHALTRGGYDLFPWQITSDNPWWSRPLKLGEIGCALSHLACWRQAAAYGYEPVLILEDDACLDRDFLPRLRDGFALLSYARWDLVYLGRVPQEPDHGRWQRFAVPGYSHCSFGYMLTGRAVRALLDARLDQALIPVDEFLPAMCTDHPRADVRRRFPKRLSALAFDPPLVMQLPKNVAGSDTEASDYVD